MVWVWLFGTFAILPKTRRQQKFQIFAGHINGAKTATVQWRVDLVGNLITIPVVCWHQFICKPETWKWEQECTVQLARSVSLHKIVSMVELTIGYGTRRFVRQIHL